MAAGQPGDGIARLPRRSILPEKTAGAERHVSAAGEVNAQMNVFGPFEPGRLADGVIDCRVKHHDSAPTGASFQRTQQIGFHGKSRLRFVPN
jgi:hypothetical protein